MDNQVPEDVKSERLVRLQELLNQQQQAFNEGTVGKTMPVLLDRKGKIELAYPRKDTLSSICLC